MGKTITNLTNPGVDPVDGDWIQETHDSGAIVKKQYWTPVQPTTAQIAARNRAAFDVERDRMFSKTEWVRQRHSDRVDQGVDDTTNWNEWLAYWQGLRDLPTTQTDFDTVLENSEFTLGDISWPTKPSES